MLPVLSSFFLFSSFYFVVVVVVCLFVCLSVCLFVCLFVCFVLFVCLFVYVENKILLFFVFVFVLVKHKMPPVLESFVSNTKYHPSYPFFVFCVKNKVPSYLFVCCVKHKMHTVSLSGQIVLPFLSFRPAF